MFAIIGMFFQARAAFSKARGFRGVLSVEQLSGWFVFRQDPSR